MRVKFCLEIAQPFPVGIEDLLGVVLVKTPLFIGLVRLEMEVARSIEAERRNEGLQLIAERRRRLLAHDVGSSGCLLDLTVHGVRCAWPRSLRSSLRLGYRRSIS